MKKILTLLCLIGLTLSIAAQPKPIAIFTNSPVTKDASLSILIKSLNTGNVIASYHASTVLAPASTMKLITTCTALETLGGDFRFTTYLETDGALENGVLKGNLYIRGTADPSLGSQKVGNRGFLVAWVNALKKAGISKIEGKVIADMSYLDGNATNPNWLWEDMGNYYAPGIFALSYLDNTMVMKLSSTAVGNLAEVLSTNPEYPGLEFENHIRCEAIGYDNAYVHGVPLSNTRYLVGGIPAGKGEFPLKGDLPNPGWLLALHLTDSLRSAGIEVSGEADYLMENNHTERTPLYEHKSFPLRDIIKETNVNSNNLYAEEIFRHMGGINAAPGTIQRSVDYIRNCWNNRGVSLQSARIMDGCGLAPTDAVSAEQFVNLLTYMKGSKNWNDFYASLPVSGQSGTLRRFLADTPLAGRVHAKSGTISNVKSYAGYIEMPDGDTYVFAILVNNQAGKSSAAMRVIEEYLKAIYREQAK